MVTKMKVQVVDNPRERTYVIIDDVKMNYKDLAEYLGVASNTVSRAFQKNRTEESRVTWIRKKRWLKERGLSSKLTVFCRGDKYVTAGQVMETTGLTTVAAAHQRGRQFEAGERTFDQLMEPVKKPKNFATPVKKSKNSAASGDPGIVRFKDENRDHNLEKIPSPTKLDKAVAGQFIGRCLPSGSLRSPGLCSNRRY